MFNLYFKDLFSVLTVAFIAGMVLFIVLAVKNSMQIEKWGRWISLFILVGTGISFLSAMRDMYATPAAVFAMDSIQSTVCSIAGALIFLTAIVSIFFKNQLHKKHCFYAISALFVLQVLVVEISRPIVLL